MKLTCNLLGDDTTVTVELPDGRTINFHDITLFYDFLERMNKVRKLMAEMQDHDESQQSGK